MQKLGVGMEKRCKVAHSGSHFIDKNHGIIQLLLHSGEFHFLSEESLVKIAGLEMGMESMRTL